MACRCAISQLSSNREEESGFGSISRWAKDWSRSKNRPRKAKNCVFGTRIPSRRPRQWQETIAGAKHWKRQKSLRSEQRKGKTQTNVSPKFWWSLQIMKTQLNLWSRLGLKQTGDCFKERTKSNIHLEYQNTESSSNWVNVHRAILRPGLYLSEIAPSAKVRRSYIELSMAFQNLWMFTLLTQNKDAFGDHIPKIKCVLLDYLSPPSCIHNRDLKNAKHLWLKTF